MIAHGTDRSTAGFLLLAGIAALAIAYGAQNFMGMVPCELCLWERWPYRILVVVGLCGLFLPPAIRRPLLWIALLALVANLGISVLHVGVERGWWPSPLPECNASNLLTTNLSTLMARLPARPAKPCDAPSYLISGLPLSFATMDLIFTLLCLGGLGARLRRR